MNQNSTHLGGDEHDAGQPEDEVEQVVDLVAVRRDVLGQPIVGARRPPKGATPRIGTSKNSRLQNFPTVVLNSDS